MVKNNRDNNLNDNKLTNINPIKINNNPTDDNHVSTKKDIDDELDENIFQNYLKVSVGNYTYILTKYNKIQMTDITEIRNANTGQMLLQEWILKCVNENYIAKLKTFLKSPTSTSPTAQSGASSIPSIGWNFMYMESSGNNHGANHISVSWERSDIIHTSNKILCNRFSTSDQNLRVMGRFRNQLLLEDKT